MKTLRKYLVRLSSFLWTAFALVTITLALLVGVGNLLMPYADRLTPRVEDWLSRQLAKPVDVRSIEAEWAAFGPRLYVQDLVIGAADDPNRLQVDNANFTIDVFGWIRPGAGGLDQFRIKVDQIEMIRREDASWQLGGLGDPGDSLRSGGNPLRWLAGLPQITLQFDQLLLRDRASDVRLSLPGGALNFDDLGDSQRVTANVGGGLAGSMKLTAIYTAEEETTEVYLEAEELPLRRWLQSSSTGLSIENGEFSVRLWGVLNGQRRDWRGDIEVTSLEVVGEGQVQGVYRLDALRSKVEAWQSPDNRGARLVDLQVTRGGRSWTSSETAVATSAQRHRVVSDHFQVDDLLDALVLLPDLPSRFRDLLAAGSPAGILNAVDILLERSEGTVHAFGRAAFRRFGWSRSGKIPGLRDLSGEVTFNGRETIARFDSTAAGLDFGELFDGPFSGVGVDGEIRIDLAQAQPHIALPGLSVTHDQIGARLNGQIVLNGQRPFLDLGLKVTRGGVADATHYWPTGKFKEPLVRWLRNALVDGRIESGRMVLYGDLDDWPFRGNEGRFEARASVTEAVLDYRQNWPRIEDLSAELVFDEFGLEATVSKGLVKGIQIGGADVDLPRFREPILTAQIEGRGNGNALLDFLRDTPLQEDYGKYTEGLAIRGKAGVDLELRLPLKPSLGRATATGEILLTDNRIFDDKWDITFEATSGRVPFDQSGFEAVDLETTFRGTPGRLTVRAGGFVADPRHAAEGILTAVSNPGILLQDFPLLLPLGDYIEGEAPWTATITVPTGGQEPRFALSCELDPQDLDLPPPLDRPAETALPVSVSFDLVEPLQELNVQVGDVLALDALRTAPRGDWSAALQLGPGEALADTTPGVAVTGSVPAFDVDAWLEVAEYWRSMVPSLDQDGRPVIKSVNIAIDHLRLASRDFADLQLQAYQEDDYWFVDLAGENVDGRLRLPSDLDENRLMVAEFDRLYWPESEEELGESHMDSRKLPPLDFYAADLRFGDVELGTVRFESFPTEYGMRIENFETQAPYFELNASGDWLALGSSDFDVTLTANDLGDALESFGFAGMVDDGQLIASLHATWPGAPQDFEMARLSGDLQLSIGKGQIIEVNPGAGRIFGLLSLQTLPRRLQLDFSDLFKSGLAFDSISGDFELNKGEAFTRDMVIKGPTADVYIQGQTNLATQDYNQVLTIVPKVSGALPLVGAIAGGGVGAAAVMVLQNVFSEQIDKMTRYHYAVTGPWSDPQVELIGANESQLPVGQPIPEALKEG